ncbi:Ribosome production factor 1 [Acipenser ruthenus]|uniref:Ribosome production factor 1 n=1 Tax=Acipenser ruthenus TaxID=7906 RepID=A0A662YVU3_ACIRT|nr:Ribosome production factor 1 [Acipenser ruthenus]
MDVKEVEVDFGTQEHVKKLKKKGKKQKPKKGKKPHKENGETNEEAEKAKTDEKPPEMHFPPTFSVSEIKNKQRRHFMFLKFKQEKRKEKLALKKKRKKERQALGDKAPPKEVPKTIENQRVYDETTVDPQDEEIVFDEGTDEFSAYFNRLTNPKILITTSDRPRGRTVRFCEQLATVIPDSHVYYRRGLALKRVIPQCIARGFTYLMVINEDRKISNGLILSHLPDGPTAHFKVSSVRLRKEMKRKGKEPTEHVPEVILNNFTTRLGHSIGRMFASLFPHDPNFVGRQVATFHNQRDYIFFRYHRYIFKNEKRVGIQELGPRFTLKLRSLQKGTFDSKFGVYEWVHKAPQPELYLLPGVENDRSVYSESLTPDRQNFNSNDAKSYWSPKRTSNLPAEKRQASRLPRIHHRTPQKPSPIKNLEDSVSLSWEEEEQEETRPSQDHGWNKETDHRKRTQEQQPPPIRKKAGDQLIEQMKLAKQERKQLEKARRELVKKAKGLLAQNHQKRKQARDAWKKRYFETKKATAPLEDTLKTLRQELETYYQKLLQQLQARDGRKKYKHPMNASNSKNGLVIQITTEQREIDKLKRKVDDAKMKLVTELKLRKQAATELRALRAELTQKKAESSLASPHQGSALQNLRYQAGPQRTPA